PPDNNPTLTPRRGGALRVFLVKNIPTTHEKKKTDLGSVARIRVYGKYFSYRMLNIHKRKKCLSDALKQPFQKESALHDARKR
ncbi:hypothetical protein, partial [Escherichia coli]|uniref:hypothetical protein n=1 Tax=Escherichia coli TaxID=562 RepID=UPI003F1FBAD9